MKRFFACFFFLFVILCADAQNHEWHTFYYDEDNGLTNTLVKAVEFDKHGFVWMATDDGIYRFDGFDIHHWKEELPSNYVKDLFTDSKGTTYISTDKGVACITGDFDPSLELLFKGGANNKDEILWYPKNVFETSDGSVWVADNKGVLQFSDNGIRKHQFDDISLPDSFLRSFQIFEWNGRIYLLSQRGECFVYRKNKFIEAQFPELIKSVHAVQMTDHGLLVAQDRELTLVEMDVDGNKRVVASFDLDVSCFHEFQGGLYCGTWNNGFHELLVQHNRIDSKRLIESIQGAINDINVQGQQMWLATDEGCIALTKGEFPVTGSLINAEAGITRYDGKIVVANENRLSFWPIVQGQLPIDEFNTQIALFDMNSNGSRAVVLDDNQLYVKQSNKQQWLKVNDNTEQAYRTIKFDAEGNLWCSQYGTNGVFKVSTTNEITSYAEEVGINGTPRVITIAENGSVWVGAEGNDQLLFEYRPASQTWLNHSAPFVSDRHVGYRVNDIQVRNDQVFLATQFGVLLYEADSVRRFDLGPYTNHDIHSLAVQEDAIWFGASDGLIRFQNAEYFVYNRRNGLPSRQVSYGGFHVMDNTLWVSTPAGFGIVDVNDATGVSPEAVIREVSVNGSMARLSETELIAGDVIQLTIGSAHAGIRNARHQYRVIHEETSDWKEVPNSGTIYLSGLEKGDHELQLRSKVSGNSQWSDISTTKFTLKEIWFKQTWAIVMLVLLITGLVFFLAMWLSRKQRLENDKLNFLVQERTIELQEKNRELVSARELAEASNKAKTDFLSSMTHEIRTPMNAVIGMTNLLKEEDLTDSQNEKLKLLSFSANNLLAIINDILDFNKIEANKLELEKAPFDLKELCVNITESLKPSALDKGLEFFFESNLSSFWFEGDRTRLSQVLINLVNNAIKFTAQGSVVLSCLEETDSDHCTTVKFKVSDTGIGIPWEKQATIFESFSQASSSTTREYGGTGLGLPIAKRLVELMGGALELESEPGTGSIFSFELSLEKAAASEEEPKSKLQDLVSLEGTHLLIAEDNPMNVAVVTAYMDRWKVSYDLANNGEEAVTLVKNNEYDLVLMDIHMPIMDGYQATKMIRSMTDPKANSLPIIALTASAMVQIQREVSRVGMNGFVSKPFQPDELHQIISKSVKSKV